VSFGDVLLSSEQVRTGPDGGDLSPGAGGWPTVRYFNKGTGYDGKPYAQKTDKAMCDELGNEDNMEAFVVDFGGASLCAVADGAGCTDKEKKFIEKWKAADAGKVRGAARNSAPRWCCRRRRRRCCCCLRCHRVPPCPSPTLSPLTTGCVPGSTARWDMPGCKAADPAGGHV
jgi:hypothetical protein